MRQKLLLFLIGCLPFVGSAQISVDVTTYTLDQLIDGVLVTGACAEVSNITSPINSQDSGEGFDSYAYFENTGTLNFPFTDGIILSTNGSQAASPSFTGFGQNGTNSWPGDPITEIIIDEPGNTNNATVIEFDFVPFVGEMSFNYFMASDEYPTFVCSYSDTFAFILSGPGISDTNSYNHDANPNTPDLVQDLGGLNIALIPGTNIPVSVTNIHTNTSCGAGQIGEFAVPQLYDDINSGNGSNEYNAQTEELTASADVIPGETYNIRLSVADRGDTSFNTAVFIEGSSFDIGEVDLGPDINLGDPQAQCEGDPVILDAGQGGTDTDYIWYAENPDTGNLEEIPGEDGQFYEVTETGNYAVAVAYSLNCLQTDEIFVEFFDAPELPSDANVSLCVGETANLDGTPINLNDLDSPEYQWFLNGNPIANATNPTIEADAAGTYTLEVQDSECTVESEFVVNLVDYSVDLGADDVICTPLGQSNEFVISSNLTGVPAGEEDDVDYEWSNMETTPNITVTESGIYTVTTTFKGCVETAEINIEFFQTPDVQDQDLTFCFEESVTLDGTPSNISDLEDPQYQWFQDGIEIVDATNSTYEATEEGVYDLEIQNGVCSAQATFTLTLIDYMVDLGSDVTVCYPEGQLEPFEIISSIMGIPSGDENQVDYEWSNGETTPNITVSESGLYTLTTTYEGCVQTADINVEFIQTPSIDLGPDTIKLCNNDEAELDTGFSDTNTTSFTWFRDGVEISGENDSTLIVSGAELGTYSVEADDNGCLSFGEITVEGYEVDNCTITQGLSPNDDGFNDCLDLTFLDDQLGINKVQIFNRYGRLIFESTDYINEFCGQNDNGDDLVTGTYFYVIDLEESDDRFSRQEKGWIYINTEQ
ncbi:choice-of-anchor L domain-containing protein [Psychroflexus aestuariivivens]|uniref:choice-of-anchor L domain-containing protein n=1 Tax=Psychroflexus aestuariivivens TaxID=1795040 RepID=UPI000FD759BF|nr:choice-of-anchor L domain-containing protein [Psychroflexus aestuariivivens]